MATTGFKELFEQLGAGQDYRAKTGADSILRFRIDGDVFPRIVLAVAAGDVLVGNGASPPVSIISGGGPGVGNGLPVYNVVAAYNADKTGVTDAASPINQAISDASAAGGGWVFVPDGTYSIASADIVLLTGVNLIAESAHGVTFVDNRASGSTIRIRGTNQATPIERVLVQDIRIVGANPGANLHKAVELRYARHCVVVNCDILNSAHGTWVSGSTASTVLRCRYTNCSTTDGTAKGAVHVVDDASGHSDSVHIVDCVFVDCYERDVVIEGTGSFRPESIELAGCRHFVGAYRGTRIRLATTRGCRVHDNLLVLTAFAGGYSTRGPVIHVSGADGAIVYGNSIALQGAAMVTVAILLDATALASSGVTVATNKFYVDASCAPSVALIQWSHTAPLYNTVGTDRDNTIVANAGQATLRSGLPDTYSETMIHGPIHAREMGVIGDGVAFDGPALLAFINRCNSEGRHGILPPHATIRCASDVSTATPLQFDRYGATSDFIIEGENSIIDFDSDLGLDAEGRAIIGWDPLNCQEDGSICLYDVTFVGNQDQSASALNPNATAVAFTKGHGVRIPNRCTYRRVKAHGFKYGFIQDGTAVQTYAATVQTNNATIAITRPLDKSWTGISVTGTNIPAGATIVTIASDGLSFTVNNAHKPTGNASSIRVSVPQNTDHFVTSYMNADANGIGLYLDRMTGANTGGTLDFHYNVWRIGRCQWAGIACSESGALHDATLIDVHVANIAYSFIKEGAYGVAGTLNTFWDNVRCIGVKSEGAGNTHFMDFSSLARFAGVSGMIEPHGVEINGQKTHKLVVNNHTYQPWSGTATRTAGVMSVTAVTAGILERAYTATISQGSTVVTGFSPAITTAENGLPISGGCIKPGTTLASVNAGANTAVLSQAAGNAGAQGPATPIVLGHGLAAGDHIAVNSTADVTYVDSAIIDSIVSGTAFTAKMGAQSKTVVTNGWATGDTQTTITGTVNVKAQDVGDIITAAGGFLDAATTVAAVNFKAQTLDFSIPATGDAANPQSITLSLADSATPRAITFGEIVGLRLGALSDIEGLKLDIQIDPTTENIGTSLWWSFYTIQDVDLTVTPTENGGMPNVEIVGGINAHMNARIRKGDAICVFREAKATFRQGDRLVGSGAVGVKVSVLGVIDAHEGWCRGGGGAASTIVNADLSVNRPVVLVQKSGSYYATTYRSEGGGVRVNAINSIAAGKILVVDDVTDPGRVKQWDQATTGLQAVAKSIGAGNAQATGFVDAELIPMFIT